MTYDVKVPRWIALTVFFIWTLSIVEGMIAQAVNLCANLHYIERAHAEPPPSYPPVSVQEKPEDGMDKRDEQKQRRGRLQP